MVLLTYILVSLLLTVPASGFDRFACGYTDAIGGTEFIAVGGLGVAQVRRYIVDVKPEWEVIGTGPDTQVIYEHKNNLVQVVQV